MNEAQNRTSPVSAPAPAAEPSASPPPAATHAAFPHPARGIDPRRKSPVLAALLSMMPGLGQVYVGYYVRGFVHAIVIGSIISILAAEVLGEGAIPLLAMFMAFFWLYNIIDAGRKAALYNFALEGLTTVDLPQDFSTPGLGGSIAAGLLLIAIGGIFLSATLFGVSLTWLKDWWPAAPILFGVYLLVRGILDRATPRT